MSAFFMAALSAIAGLLGGWVALSGRVKSELLYGFTAGTLIGLTAFGLFPEIIEISDESTDIDIIWSMIALVAGFLTIHILEKLYLVHHSHEESYAKHSHQHSGTISTAILIGHSFLDGLTIGLAFQIDNAFGMVVALGVIGHRFADGINIANIMVKSGNGLRKAQKMVWLGAIAPVAGVLCSQFFSVPEEIVIIYLGYFAGIILYIAASDILPQAHSKSSGRASLLFTMAGVVFMYIVSRLA